MSRKMIMSLAAGLVALTALHSPAAEAKGKGKHFHHPKHHVFGWHKWHVVPYRFATYDGCGFYYWKWKKYGGAYWKTKYFLCTGIY